MSCRAICAAQAWATQGTATEISERVGGPDNRDDKQHGKQAEQPLAANLSQGQPGKPCVENGRRRPETRATPEPAKAAPAAPIAIAASAMAGSDVRMNDAGGENRQPADRVGKRRLPAHPMIVENS
jgi:hypothetical protein